MTGPSSTRDRTVFVLAVLVALLAGYIVGNRGFLADSASGSGEAQFEVVTEDSPTLEATTTIADAPTPTTAAATTLVEPEATETPRFSDLPPIELTELPIEAIETLALIDDDGPYPYSKDGSTFQNREALLPDFDRGHYREFTVTTPGSSDRGAKRIVAGALGERYYTSDHYASFSEIIR